MASGDFLENESFEFPNYKPLDPVHTGNKPCIICNKPSIMPCPECQKFSYCSDKHQNLHFKTHQFDCLGRGILLAVPNSIPSHIKNKKSVDFNGFVEKDKKIVEKELRFIDTRVEKLIEEREKLRKELIASFTSLINEAKKGGSEGVLNLGQRLVKASYKLYEIANKADSREFYEYCADHLLLVRALIRYEQMRSARDNLILILPMVTRIVDRSEKFKEIAKTTDISSIEFINTDIDALGYHKKLLINNELKRRANLLSLLASGFYSVEDFKNCEMFFVKYLTLVEKSYGSKSLEMSNCYFMIGEFYYQLEQLPKALKSFKWSYEIRKGKLGEKHDSVGDCWYNLGVVYKNFNEPLKAFLLLEKALEQKRESKGELSLPCALVLEVQGKVLLEGGDYKASLVKLSDCYNIRKKLLNNAKHPELIRISLLLMHLSKLINGEILNKHKTSSQPLEVSKSFSITPRNNEDYSINSTRNERSPIEEIDEENVVIENKALKNYSHKKAEIIKKKKQVLDLPLDPDFLASLSLEQLLKFSELRKKVLKNPEKLKNIAEIIHDSDFINSLNRLQHNTFMFSLKELLTERLSPIQTEDINVKSLYKGIGDSEHLLKLNSVAIDNPESLSKDLLTSFSIGSKKNSPNIGGLKKQQNSIRLGEFPKPDGLTNPFNDSDTKSIKQFEAPKILIPLPLNLFSKNPPLPEMNAESPFKREFTASYENFNQGVNLDNNKVLFERPNNLIERPNNLIERPNNLTERPYNPLEKSLNLIGEPNNLIVDGPRNILGEFPTPPNLLGNSPAPPNLLNDVQGPSNFELPNLLDGTPRPSNLMVSPTLINESPALNLYGGIPPNLVGGPSGPPNLLDITQGTPNLLGGPPNLLGGPPNLISPILFGGPPNLISPNLLGGPPNLLGGPPNLLGGPPNLLGGPPAPPNLLGGPPNILGGLPNLLGGPPAPPNLLGGTPAPPNLFAGPPAPNLLGGPPAPNLLGGPPAPPNLFGGPPAPNLLGGPPAPPNLFGGPPAPNLLGGPPAPPNIFGGPPAPNLLGGPPGPPNLFGGPPGPPNLFGGPPGPPNLLGGPPNLLGGGPKLPSFGLPGLKMGGAAPSLGPKSKTKPLFWDLLPAQQIGNSIWTEANKLPVDNIVFDDLEDIFSNAAMAKTPSTELLIKKLELVCLLPDDKKANNMNIMLTRFKKFSMDSLKTAILTLKPDIISLDAAQALLRFPPESDELERVRSYDGSLDNLDPASQFLFAIKEIPRYQIRLRGVVLREEFNDRFEPAIKAIDILQKALIVLKENIEFKRFLKLVLELGNKMNSGSNRGNALGFKLSSLSSLLSMKSSKDSRTLFQYIMEKIVDQKPELLSFQTQFEIFSSAAQINLEEPLKELEALNGQMVTLKNNMEVSLKGNPPDLGFVEAFNAFKEKNLQRAFEAKENALKTKGLYIEIAKLYGEDEASIAKKTTGDFFGVLVTFNEKIKLFLKEKEDKRIKELKKKK